MKAVAPLGGGRMKNRHNTFAGFHQGVGIVFYIVLPITVRNKTVNIFEFSRKKPQEIHHVNALVEQDAPAGDASLSAPVFIEIDHLRFAVNTPKINQTAEFTALDDSQSLAN